MKLGWPLLTIVVLLLVSAPALADEDEPKCIHPPDLAPSYTWTYVTGDNGTRTEQVVRESKADTPQGREETIQLEFRETDAEGNQTAYGQQIRYGQNATYPWGLVRQTRWAEHNDTVTRRTDGWDPPFQLVHLGRETCPGDFRQYTTYHSTSYGPYGDARHHEANETWRVRVGPWTNVTVPAGTFEALPVTADQGHGPPSERYRIRAYWSPEVQGVVARVQGGGGVTERSLQLESYVLNRQPYAIIEASPSNPQAGDTIELDGTKSVDPDGNVTSYHWRVGNRTFTGSTVAFDVNEETTLPIELTVGDDGNRSAHRQTSLYIAPAGGDGLGLTGPTEALEGEIVTLEARTSFEPVRIQWRENDTVVGQGPTFRFYMERSRNLTVDAIHESGRVYSRNHVVDLVERGDAGHGGDRWPPSGEPTILEPLEGQVVPQRTTVRVDTDVEVTLLVDGRPVWQGGPGDGEEIDVDMEPGRHTLKLASQVGNQTVNVTAVGDAGKLGQGASGGPSGSAEGGPLGVAAPGAVLVAVTGLAVAALRRQ